MLRASHRFFLRRLRASIDLARSVARSSSKNSAAESDRRASFSGIAQSSWLRMSTASPIRPPTRELRMGVSTTTPLMTDSGLRAVEVFIYFYTLMY